MEQNNELLMTRSNEFEGRANAISITTQEEYVKVADFIKGIKGLSKQISETFDPIIAKAYSAHKEAVAQKKKFTDKLDNAERIIKTKMNAWTQAQEKLRIEAQRKAEEAEKKRLEEEALAKASKESDPEKQEEILNTAINEKPFVAPKEVAPKVEGVSTRKVYKWDLVDVKMVAIKYLMVNEKEINKIVTALGPEAEMIVGGIKVREEVVTSIRA